MKKQLLCISAFLALLLVFTLPCTAQTMKARKLVKNVDMALNNIETAIFKIDRKDMYFAKSDTVQRTAICSIQINREDPMSAYHKIDILDANNNYTVTKYDGKHLFVSTSSLDSLSFHPKTTIKNVNEDNFLSYAYRFNSYLIMGHYETKRSYRQLNSLLARLFFIKKINVEEAIHNGTPVYILSVYTKNGRNFMDDAVMNHYIRKSDFLPIAYSFSGHFENIEEYEYYEIDYLEINSNILFEDFTISEEDKEQVLLNQYNNFIEKLNY